MIVTGFWNRGRRRRRLKSDGSALTSWVSARIVGDGFRSRSMTEQMAIELTPSAAEHVRDYLSRHEGIGLRLGVKPTGCSGWAYDVSVAEEINEDDSSFESNGVTVVIAADALPMIEGTQIDFVTEGLNRTFVFRNPNVTDECGCGESFTVGSMAG